MNIKVVVEQAEDGGYFIYVPALPGVVADGRTRDEAVQGIRSALHDYLEPGDEDLPVNRELVRELEF